MTLEEFEKRFQFDTAENSPDYRGSGGFGAVYRAYDSQRERYVAIKESVMRPEFRQFSLRHEVENNHEMAPHPNLLRYENNYRFQMGKLTVDYAVMKYFEHGNLDQFLRRSPDLPVTERDQLIAGLLAGLQHLRSERCIHRDLKASNVLVDRQDDQWIPIIADFGQSRFVGMGDLTSNSSESFSLDYASPEQFEEDGKVSMATDMWAFGVLLHRIVTGRLPFAPLPGKDTTGKRAEVLQLITGGHLPAELSTIPEPYQEAIRQCLVKDPQQRALPSTIQTILFGDSAQTASLTSPGINSNTLVPRQVHTVIPTSEPIPVEAESAPPQKRFLTGLGAQANADLAVESAMVSGLEGPGTNSGFIISHESPPPAEEKKRRGMLIGLVGLAGAALVAFLLFRPSTKATTVDDQLVTRGTQLTNPVEVDVTGQGDNALIVEKKFSVPQNTADRKTTVVDNRPTIAVEALEKTSAPVLTEMKLADDLNRPVVTTSTQAKNEEKAPPAAVAAPEKPAPAPPVTNPNDVLAFAEQMPEFPGGEEAMIRWIGQHIRYPTAAEDASISGKVFVSFNVDLDGKISDVNVVKGLGYGTEKEAIRVIKGMPKWKPGRQGGSAVRVRQTIPIQFRLE